MINTSYSSPSNLSCGIPQGSILGPLLLLLYINDLPQAVVSDSLRYAVDFELMWLVCWQQIKYMLWARQNKINVIWY